MSRMNDTTLNNSNSGGGGGGGNSSSHQLSFLPGNTTISNGLGISSGHEVTGVGSQQQRQQQPMTSCSQHSSIVGGGGGGTIGSGGSEIENMLRSHVNLMVAIQKSQSDLGMHVQHSIASINTNVANLTEEVKSIKAFLHQVVSDRALKDELVSWRTLADSLISRNEASHKLEIQRMTELFGTLSTTNAAAMAAAGSSTGGGPSSASAMSAQQQAVLLQYLSQAMYPAAGLHQYGVAGMPPPSTMPAANVPRGHSDGQQMPASVGTSQLTGQFPGARDIKQVTKVEHQQQPAGGISFGAVVPPQQAIPQAPQQQSSQPSAAGDMNRFKLNPATHWRCSLCYLENELSRAKCISCNSDQPASNKIQQQQQAPKQQPAVAVKPQEPVKPQVAQATPPSGGSGGASSFRFVPPSAAANTPQQVTPPQPAQQPQQGLFKPAPTFVSGGSIFGKPQQSTPTITSTPAGSSPAAKPAGASPLTLFGGGMGGGSGGFADLAQKSAAGGGLFSNTGSKGSSSFLSGGQASGNSPFGQPQGLFQKPTPKAEPAAEDGEAGGDDRPEAFVPDAHYEPVVPLPALVEVRTGEEGEDIVFSARCKLYRFDATLKENKEKGLGDMRILYNPQTKRYRCVMRREKVLKLCANFAVTPGFKITQKTHMPTAYTWGCHDYSDRDEHPNGVDESFTARFKDESIAGDFKEKIEWAAKGNPPKATVAPGTVATGPTSPQGGSGGGQSGGAAGGGSSSTASSKPAAPGSATGGGSSSGSTMPSDQTKNNTTSSGGGTAKQSSLFGASLAADKSSMSAPSPTGQAGKGSNFTQYRGLGFQPAKGSSKTRFSEGFQDETGGYEDEYEEGEEAEGEEYEDETNGDYDDVGDYEEEEDGGSRPYYTSPLKSQDTH